jgi:hypothetical protein
MLLAGYEEVIEARRRKAMLDAQMEPGLCVGFHLPEVWGPPDDPERRRKRDARRVSARKWNARRREAREAMRDDSDTVHVVRVRGTTVFLPL